MQVIKYWCKKEFEEENRRKIEACSHTGELLRREEEQDYVYLWYLQKDGEGGEPDEARRLG